KFQDTLTETLTVDSLTSDTLVLSGGGTWKFNKTEFKRTGGGAVAGKPSGKYLGFWKLVKSESGDKEIPLELTAKAWDSPAKCPITSLTDNTLVIENNDGLLEGSKSTLKRFGDPVTGTTTAEKLVGNWRGTRDKKFSVTFDKDGKFRTGQD